MGYWTRRDVLKAATAGGALTLPGARALAQSGAAALARAPKRALVIGNSRYKDAPLKNPENDAKGIASALQTAGFNVTLALDTTRAAALDAIDSYSAGLAKDKAVGVFYFAGHGAQLAWRNYLLPVDAHIDNVQQLRERAVDLNNIIDGIRKAGNPMNVLIMDACRDNPFGKVPVDQKGLSQMDAPPGTLLAYATAPGNTASDGDGINGLYTEHLLKEILMPDAKIEDVFKRVRLGVRRKSNGQQIPWESTSLEEDFWFLPPLPLQQLLAQEREREQREQQAAWDLVKDAQSPAPVEEFLRRYPGGPFTAQAEARLEFLARREGERAEQRRKQLEEERNRVYREQQPLWDKVKDATTAPPVEDFLRRYPNGPFSDLARKRLSLIAASQREARELSQKEQEARREREYREQSAIWDRIKESSSVEALEEFLRRYPSGPLSELAQAQLDRILARQGEQRVEAVTARENPYTKGTARASTAYKVGDRYFYRVVDTLTGLEERERRFIVKNITDTEIQYQNGATSDLLGNMLTFVGGAQWSTNQIAPAEFAVGKRWTTTFRVIDAKGRDTVMSLNLRIVGKETVKAPAGEFEAFRIEGEGWRVGGEINHQWSLKRWYAPDRVRHFIVNEVLIRAYGKILESSRTELVSFQQG